jgi:hypothetical protein
MGMKKGETVVRFGNMRDMDRSFDVEFWQAQGPEAIFDAAWDMVVQAWQWKGRDPAELEFHRSIERTERRGS